MSSTAIRRIVSGSAATWCRIGVTIFCQIALVPVYLSHWNAEIYGVWLALTALMGLLQIVSNGFQSYLQNEFLRIGAARSRLLRRVFWSAAGVGGVVGLVEFFVTIGLASSDWVRLLVGASFADLPTGALVWVIVANAFVWLLCGCFGGLAVRLLACFGHFAALAWWGVGIGLVIGVAPALAVVAGGDFLIAGVTLAVVTLIVNVPLFLFILRRMGDAGMFPVELEWRRGWYALLRSQVLTARNLLDMLRQQGVRIIMAPLAGAAELAAFATTRTGANVALQGLGTITQPLMPELMRFLNARDQPRAVGAFGAVWLVLVALMIPGAMVMQFTAAPLFELWTKGKIPFDPALFALLTSTVLLFALGQPAQAIITGHNLLRVQFLIALAAGFVGVGGMFILVPALGVVGAAVALLLAEALSTFACVVVAAGWMNGRGMRWPWLDFAVVGSGTVLCMVVLALMVLSPRTHAIALILVLGLGGSSLLSAAYWFRLPAVVRQRLAGTIVNRWRK